MHDSVNKIEILKNRKKSWTVCELVLDDGVDTDTTMRVGITSTCCSCLFLFEVAH